MDASEHPYLGTRLSPAEYYRRHAHRYSNPHAEGIAEVLAVFADQLGGRVLDLGCGDGLATKLLAGRGLDFVGVDNAPGMVKRYRRETGFPAEVAGFAQVLPSAECAVSSYAMHLMTPEEASMVWYRLWEAGVKVLVVVTPFKERPEAPGHYFTLERRHAGPHGPDGKTIHGRLYRRIEA